MRVRVDTFMREDLGRTRWAASQGLYDRFSSAQTDRCYGCGSTTPREEIGPGVTQCGSCGRVVHEEEENPV